MDDKERLRLIQIQKRRKQLSEEMTHPAKPSKQPLTTTEKIASNPIVRGAVAMGEPIINLSELIMRGTGIQGEGDEPGIFTQGLNEYKDIVRGAEEKMQPHQQVVGNIADIGGNIASPLYWAAPGLRGASATAPGRILQGGEAGLLAGASQETDPNLPYWEQKAPQLVAGTVAGVAGSTGFEAGRTAFNFGRGVVNPLTHKGRVADVDESLRELVGDSSSDTVRMLNNAKPGQTSGQAVAAGNRGSSKVSGSAIPSLEKDIAKKYPVADRMQSIYKGQQNRRIKFIDSIAGTDEMLKSAYSARTKQTERLYTAAIKSKKSVDVGRVRSAINGYLARNPADKPLVGALGEIIDGLKDTSPRNLISLSKRIGTMMSSKTPGGAHEYNVAVLDSVKDILDKQIGKAEPMYSKAQKLYADLSKPINKMETARVLRNALVNSREGETAPAFLNAMRDTPKTMKKGTGFSRYENLEEIMDPRDMAKINRIKGELLVDEEASRLARAVTTSSGDLVSETSRLPAVLKTEVVIANHLLKKLSDKSTGADYQSILMERFSNPQKLAEVLSKPAGNKTRKALLNGLVRAGIISSPEVIDKAIDLSLVQSGFGLGITR